MNALSNSSAESSELKGKKFSAVFKCFAGCPGEYPLEQVIYRCPHCGGLLEVVHDVDELKKVSADTWMHIMDERNRSFEFPHASGVWSKKEWTLPQINDSAIVSLREGNSHLFHGKKLSKLFNQDKLYVKLCGDSHTGSFKDLGMTALVSQVNASIKNGNSEIEAVACASTGDTSAALAAYAAYAEIPAIILLPRNKVSLAQLIQPVSNGALVLALDTDFDGCMRVVQELTQEPSIYLANSMNSLRIEGQKSVGIEIVQQLGWQVPDWFVIPGGNAGNVSALGNGLKLLKQLGIIDKMPRIAVAQTEKANPIYLAYKNGFENFAPVQAQKTLASAIQIGNPVSIAKAIKTLQEFNGVVEQASEQELAEAAAKADLGGLLCDPHTGVALSVLQKLQQKNIIRQEESVAIISTANGLKFADFKVGYHEQKLAEVVSQHPNKPIEIDANLQDVKTAVKKRFS